MIGPPGGGKSYEATVYHVLASIEAGRKVITNLPLNVDEFAKIVPAARTLIEVRDRRGKPGEPETWAFGHLDDYGDSWRHPETNIGALYVIDEAHKPLPRRLAGDRSGVKLDEWYAEHRHEGCDLLLLTQSYGKISKAICDQVQVCYRVKKKTVFGDSSGYIRKVQDGVKGEVISIAERTYEPRYFKLYKSHTRSEAAVIEADARDVRPAFLRWKRAGYAVILVGAVGLVWQIGTAWFGEDAKPGRAASGAAERKYEHRQAPEAVPAVGKPSTDVVPAAQAVNLSKASREHRIVGAVTGTAGGGYVVVYSKEREFRLPLVHCHRDEFDGWICPTADGFASMTTGPEPPRSEGGLLASFVAPPSP